jgi:WD40 repeat protein
LVLCPRDGDLRLLDTKTGKLSKLDVPGRENLVIAVTADGAKVATKEREDSKTKLLDIKSGQISSLPGAQKFTEEIAFSANGKTLYEGSHEKPYLTAVSIDDGKKVTLPEEMCNSEIYEIALTSDGKMLIAGNKSEIRAWNFTTNALQWVCKKNDPNLWNLTCTLKASPDNKIVAASSTDMKIRLWNLATGKLLYTLFKSSDVIQDIAISPDSKKIAMCNDAGKVVVWSMDTGKELGTVSVQAGSVNSLSFSPDEKMLIGGSTRGSVVFWSADNLNELCSVVPVDKSDWVVLDAQREHFDASPGGAHLIHIYKDGAFLPSEEVKKIGYRSNLFVQETGGKLPAK